MGGVLRGIFGYCFLIFIVRIVGRRPGKQITPFEYILIFFMGGVTLTPMVGDDRSITNAIVTIMSIALTHFVIIWLKTRSRTFARIVDGPPLVLLDKGRWQTETMAKMRLTDDDVMTFARDQGLERLDQIEYAVLERNGEVSIIKKSEGS
ncbi:MAG: DUF421 domain-containing protein [Acidobacteriaceae bacterium]|nr:DUF421 domain-containing protein [Acidobacteriaceae bacterium]